MDMINIVYSWDCWNITYFQLTIYGSVLIDETGLGKSSISMGKNHRHFFQRADYKSWYPHVYPAYFRAIWIGKFMIIHENWWCLVPYSTITI